MAKREWNPSDLPADFRLFEWDFARNDLITLDANGRIASIADTWQGRLASTASVNDRRALGMFEGVQGAYKAGSGADTRADGIILSDLAGLPNGNADRYLGFAAVAIDGIIGGYRGNTDKIYCFDTPSDPGLRFYYDNNRATSQLPVDKTLAHFYAGNHASSVTKLRVDGVDAGSYPAMLQTVPDQFGIAGAQTDFYGIVGYSFYAIVGKIAATQDQEWLIEAWVAKYKTKRAVPNDNPYRTALPEVDDGTTPSTAGESAATLAAVGAAGSAALKIAAAAALTIGAVGSASDARAQIAAQAGTTLGAIAAEGAAGIRVTAAAAVPLGTIASTSTGTLPLRAESSPPMGSITCVAAGTAPVLAAASIALNPIGTVSAARTDIRGSVSASLGRVTTNTDAGRTPQTSGIVAAALGPIVSAAAGQARIAASAGPILAAVRSAGLGAAEMRGRVNQPLGSVSAQASGASPGSGAASILLDGVHSTAPAALRLTGVTAGTLGAVILEAKASEFNWAPTPPARTTAAPAQVRVAFTTRQVRLLYASKDNRMLIWPTKRVAEVLDYALDWSARIGDEAIVSSKAAVRGDMVTIDRDKHDGKVQQVWLAGGVNGVGHIIMQVTTDAGRVYEEAVQLSVAV